jgi:Nif-specific regulatory protein
MKQGAYDYLTKPFSVDELDVVLEKALEHRKLVDENKYLREEIGSRFNHGTIVGAGARMKQVYGLVAKVAPSDASVFIQGESGTGKELVARAIHYNSPRAQGPFIKVNCAALSSTLLESELFGHEKGAFTNAICRKLGRFELADKGTLLLDEVSEIEPGLQAKLLRVLQEREFDRVGGTGPIKTDVRIIATTNRKISEEIRGGRFREDLYYRLNVVPVFLPPLRERREDIPELVAHFIGKYNAKNGKKTLKADDAAMKTLLAYDWPGNVRELENCIERAVVLSSGELLLREHFLFEPRTAPAYDGGQTAAVPGVAALPAGDIPADVIEPLALMEKKAILRALESCAMNKAKAALILGVTARTLRNKLKEYELEGEIFPFPSNVDAVDNLLPWIML